VLTSRNFHQQGSAPKEIDIMYSYPHHIGDFIKDTARLTDAQAMTYLRMIWMYYDTEAPLPADSKRLAFMLGACAEDAQLILEHYFCRDGDFYRHKRCDAEIQAYRGRQEHGRKAAKSRWENAQSIPGAYDGHTQSTKKHANREPITDNREPVIKETRKRVDPPTDVGQQVWADWIALRKAKRAPVTATVIEGARKEAAKAGMTLEEFLKVWCQRGSQGLQADWLKPNERNQSKSFAQQEREMGWKRWEEMTGRQHPDRLAHESKSHGQVIELDGGNFLEIEQ
jgi:uncharacterized protein YdaU (DUF1376 family)